jgi:hypothetical protein
MLYHSRTFFVVQCSVLGPAFQLEEGPRQSGYSCTLRLYFVRGTKRCHQEGKGVELKTSVVDCGRNRGHDGVPRDAMSVARDPPSRA